MVPGPPMSEGALSGEEDLIPAVLAGERRALARLLTRIESRSDLAEAVVQRLHQHAGRAHVVGLTGAPGTGKSTLAAALARELRGRGESVAIVAVDPSSPLNGGALLGDRIRMSSLSGDAGIYMRSMAGRGTGSGLSKGMNAVATVLAAAGFGVVLVETVGAGQDEVAIAEEAQTTVVVTSPGAGDDIQAMKAGILEIADVLVVNKADQEGADRLVAALTFGRGRAASVDSGAPYPAPGAARGPEPSGFPGGHGEGTGHPTQRERGPLVAAGAGVDDERLSSAWDVAVLKTVATTGRGVVELGAALRRHRTWLAQRGRQGESARAMAEQRILRWVAAKAVERATAAARHSDGWSSLVDAVAAGHLAPSAAAGTVLHDLAAGPARERPAQELAGGAPQSP